MTSLYFDVSEEQWPIIYHEKYNVSFGGFEKLHVFDAQKWRNIIQHLLESNFITQDAIVRPVEAKDNDLKNVHSKRYLKSLKIVLGRLQLTMIIRAVPGYGTVSGDTCVLAGNVPRDLEWSAKVAVIAELPLLVCVPNVLVQRAYLKPMRYQTGGSVLAGKLALERGWAINVGGGFHHCSRDSGGGFCPYADITMLIKYLKTHHNVQNVMIVDLDAHQGNGYQRDFIGVPEVYIMDMYNKHIYPRDQHAKQAIRRKIELGNLVEDAEYLLRLKRNLKAALKDFMPDILVYNAGTDILESDPLGHLSITDVGIIERDQHVFNVCREKKIPIVMLTSGGYLKKTAKIIADSIMNLGRKGLISGYNAPIVE